MSVGQAASIAAIILVVGVLVSLNVWWRRHRAQETAAEKKAEDRVIEQESRTW